MTTSAGNPGVVKKQHKRINPECQVLTNAVIEELKLDAIRKEAKDGAKNRTMELAKHVKIMEAQSQNKAKESSVEKRVLKKKAENVESEVEETESESDLDNVPLVNDSREYSAEDGDKEGPTSVHFNERQFSNLYKNIKIDIHYLVSFGKDLCYIGKIVDIKKASIIVKFMKQQPGNMFVWKANEKTEEVRLEQFVCGPQRLHGTMPYNINGVDTAYHKYLKQKKI